VIPGPRTRYGRPGAAGPTLGDVTAGGRRGLRSPRVLREANMLVGSPDRHRRYSGRIPWRSDYGGRYRRRGMVSTLSQPRRRERDPSWSSRLRYRTYGRKK